MRHVSNKDNKNRITRFFGYFRLWSLLSINLIAIFDSMFILTAHNNARLKFVVSILAQRYSVEFKITTSKDVIPIGDTFINYTPSYMPNGIWIVPEGLLEEKSIRRNKPVIEPKSNLIFSCSVPEAYDFDLLAAVFYMLSRYEEYQKYTPDKHGRFTSHDSIAKALNKLKKPFIDYWLMDFGALLETKGVNITFPTYHYMPTVDVDIAYAYKCRPLWLTLANYGKSIINGRLSEIKNRFLVNVGLRQDPYDTFDLIKEQYSGSNAYMFFQVGLRSDMDKNISPYEPEMKKLIANTDLWATVGLHPSYESNKQSAFLTSEKKILERIIDGPVLHSRQHFLKLKFPNTYRSLIKNGIQCDFTLGFAEDLGFRAGTCHPFPFYDLEKEQLTDLTIYPLSIMDGTLKDYLKLSPDSAIKEIRQIIKETKEVNGTFVSLWHNSSFSEIEDWNEWMKVFKFMHKEAIS